MSQISNDDADQGKLYQWQTSEDKPGEGGAAFSAAHVGLVFVLCFGFGYYMKFLS